MITDGAEELPESLATNAKDSFLFDEALIALQKYSLIEVEDEKLSIHRLVQAVIRHAMNEEAVKLWAGVAVHVVNVSFPLESDDVRTWPQCLPLISHASTTLSHAETIQFTSDKTVRLLNQLGVYLYARAEYEQARRMYERAIAVDEVTLDPDHPDVAIRLNNLGSVLREQGDLEGAKALFERALHIFREFLGDDHPNTKTVQGNLHILEQEMKNAEH